jgi:glycine cleavage system H protein
MPVPTDRKYLESHEWHQLTAPNEVTIGITQIAADDLTDITYVELPAIGAKFEAGKPFGVIESVKATSDLYTGIAGTVSSVNTALKTNPGLVNTDPFGKGWMIRLKVTDPDSLAKLLSADDYLKKVGH